MNVITFLPSEKLCKGEKKLTSCWLTLKTKTQSWQGGDGGQGPKLGIISNKDKR